MKQQIEKGIDSLNKVDWMRFIMTVVVVVVPIAGVWSSLDSRLKSVRSDVVEFKHALSSHIEVSCYDQARLNKVIDKQDAMAGSLTERIGELTAKLAVVESKVSQLLDFVKRNNGAE